MKISDIYSAKGLKINFTYDDSSVKFVAGMLVRIDSTQKEREYLVSQYAQDENSTSQNPVTYASNCLSRNTQ